MANRAAPGIHARYSRAVVLVLVLVLETKKNGNWAGSALCLGGHSTPKPVPGFRGAAGIGMQMEQAMQLFLYSQAQLESGRSRHRPGTSFGMLVADLSSRDYDYDYDYDYEHEHEHEHDGKRMGEREHE